MTNPREQATARVRIKFCGMTRVEDALDAARLGVDAIGLIFAPQSRRRVTFELAREIAQALPPFVTRVGLFMDPEEAFVRETIDRVPLDLLQFHGNESPAFCRRFGRPYLKAVPMLGEDDTALTRAVADYADAAALLLDAHAPGAAGGTGSRFDWTKIPAGIAGQIVLAGGLTPENVAAAVETVRPYAVDVASGIESAPGIKDPVRMKRFIDEVRRGGG